MEVHPLEWAELRPAQHQECYGAAGQDGGAQLSHQVSGRQDGEFVAIVGGMYCGPPGKVMHVREVGWEALVLAELRRICR